MGRIHGERGTNIDIIHLVRRCTLVYVYVYVVIPRYTSICIIYDILMHLYVYRRWNGCFLGEYGGIVVCGENTEEETERTERFCSATRLNTGGLHRITLLQTIHSGKKFSFRFYQAKVLV